MARGIIFSRFRVSVHALVRAAFSVSSWRAAAATMAKSASISGISSIMAKSVNRRESNEKQKPGSEKGAGGRGQLFRLKPG